ncbi:hypothetical protein MRX96_027838 [Rhipicephalus microplus]
MAAEQGRRQRKMTCEDDRSVGMNASRNSLMSLMVVVTQLLALPPETVAKNPFGPALKAFNHSVDVPERYIPDLPQAKWGDSVRKYSVRNCGSRYDAVQYEELRLRPDPLSFPGSVFVTSAIKVSRNVTAPIKVNIIMKKKVYLWVTVPCVNDFGSCDYDDICDVQDCPLFYDFLGLPCGCPIKEGDYSVRNKEFEVPALLLPDWITSGDYQVTVKARSRGEPLFCVHFTLSLK